MKTLKFKPELIELMRRGEKTITWRLFDDKNLEEGDSVALVDKQTLTEAGHARIKEVHLKKLKDITSADYIGHERYVTKEEMYETYRGYYGDRVTPETQVKIITLSDIVFS